MAFHWNIKPDTPEWHAIRAKNIGGSEAPGLWGKQAAWGMSAYTLWAVKSGLMQPPPVDDGPNTIIWAGKRLEPVIGTMAAEINQWAIQPGPYVTDDLCPGAAASLDFIIKEPGPEEIELGWTGPGVLQTKNCHLISHARDWTAGEPPFHVLLQLQHEIGCSGFSWGAISGLVGGTEIKTYRYAAWPGLIEENRHRVTDLWQHVRDRKPPHTDDSESTAKTLEVLYPPKPDKNPIDLTSDNELPEICAAVIVAKADVEAAERNLAAYENRLAEKMQGARHAFAQGYRISGTYNPGTAGKRAGDLPPDKVVGAKKPFLWWRVREDNRP